MLNEATRTRGSEHIARPLEQTPEAFRLTCRGCGSSFEAAIWQPVLRCPECKMEGSPDRALRNLLPTGWDCLSCGHANSGRVNFCLSCGSGLSTRCARCEAP